MIGREFDSRPPHLADDNKTNMKNENHNEYLETVLDENMADMLDKGTARIAQMENYKLAERAGLEELTWGQIETIAAENKKYARRMKEYHKEVHERELHSESKIYSAVIEVKSAYRTTFGKVMAIITIATVIAGGVYFTRPVMADEVGAVIDTGTVHEGKASRSLTE